MKPPFWLKPRSSFPNFTSHREYAKRCRFDNLYWSYGSTAIGGANGLTAISEIADSNVHGSPLIPIAFFAGPVLVGQLLFFRGLAAEDRMNESWEDFELIRQEELAAKQPPTDTPAVADVPASEPQEQPPQTTEPLPQPPQETPKSSDQQ